MIKILMSHKEVNKLLCDGYDMYDGWINEKPWHRKVVYRWRDMWRRCYDTTSRQYNDYKNVIIADEFKLFSNYLKWFMSQANFELFCSDTSVRYSVDKDAGGGHYFPYMMILTTASENTKERNDRKGVYRPIIGIPLKSSTIILFKTLAQSKNKGFNPGNIVSCIKGRQKSSKGYKWYYISYKHDKIYRRVK